MFCRSLGMQVDDTVWQTAQITEHFPLFSDSLTGLFITQS